LQDVNPAPDTKKETPMIQRRFPKLLGLGLAATLATTTAAAWADAPQTGTPTGPPGHHRFQERLGLTDQQKAAIKEVNARHSGERKQLGQSLSEARNELKVAGPQWRRRQGQGGDRSRRWSAR
jgi:Spy/CpxP family protein refolding chaperone